jgi:PAS domain S-box-containing protein
MPAKESAPPFHIRLDDSEIIINPAPEERFDRLTRIAKHTFNVPIALICLKDSNQRLWLKSAQGLALQEFTLTQQSFCHASLPDSNELLYIPDTAVNGDFCKATCVSATRAIRFYAGAPILLAQKKIGTLCILDYSPRTLTADDLAILRDLAYCVEVKLKKIHSKLLAQRLHKQKTQLSTAFNTIVDGVISIDSRGIIQTVNNATLAIFGYALEDMRGKNIKMIMPEPFHSAHDRYLSNYLSTKTAKIIGIGREVQGVRRDGTVFPMSLAVGEMIHGNEKHFVGIIRDLSEQKKNQQALTMFKYALDHTVDCVFLCRMNDFRFLYVNEGAKQQAGYSEAELLTMSVLDIKPEFTHDSYRQLIATLLNGEKSSLTFETVHRHKNGTEIPVEVMQQLIRQEGQVPTLLCIVRDLTERKVVENLKNQFVSTVSHELRTPLTSIHGALGLVLGGVLGDIPEKVRSLLEIANRNSEQLTLLINDLLDLEKIESNRMVFDFELIDLIRLVRHALETNQGYADQYTITLTLQSPQEEAWVYADKHRLLQVLANLLSNAIKWSHSGDRVSVTIEQQQSNYTVLIQDFGNGIPEVFRAHIFERFAQAHGVDNRQKSGSGLGLSISKEIIEHHQGSIGFNSTEGKGSTFFFSLPIKNTPHPPCILFCKNDKHDSSLLTNRWKLEGFLYDLVNTIAEAKTLLTQKDYDLMVLDASLPVFSNMAFIQELRALPNAAELSIVITSLAEKDRQDKILLPDDMQKSVSRDRLYHTLQLALLASHCTNVLHVEDDLNIIDLVNRIFSNTEVNYHAVTSLADAHLFLTAHPVDLIILDGNLPDGSSLELLTKLNPHCRIIVFSDHNISDSFNKDIAFVLMKSAINREQLRAIRSTLNK